MTTKLPGEIQHDTTMRVVALTNLHAMCERASGMCHRYWVKKVTPNRVHVCYSNPDEYGLDYVATAVFPAFPNPWGEKGNPYVVIGNFVTIYNDPDDIMWQFFDLITDGPALHRSSPDADDRRTKDEILAAQEPSPDKNNGAGI